MNWSLESLQYISRAIYFWTRKDIQPNASNRCMEFTIIDEYKDQIIKFSDMSFAINNKNENNLLITVEKDYQGVVSWALIPKELAEKLIIYKELKK
jgi:hypothetical protein